MTQPTVSVLVPSFNHGRFIDQAIGSALESRPRDIEIVVVDDGSTDDTRDRLRSYDGDRRVRVILQENRGAHAALNRALDLARGEFVFILDSDDAFGPERIPQIVDHLRSHPETALAASWIEIIDDNGGHLGTKRGWHSHPPWPPPTGGPYLSSLEDPVLALLETNYISTTSNLAFRRALAAEHGLRFRPLRYAHDWDFTLTASRHGGIGFIADSSLKYRIHGANTIREGLETDAGLMRFEIMWVVARHAHHVLDSARYHDYDSNELLELFWNSAPTFGKDGILERLLLLRGCSDDPPTTYDTLLEPAHPFHRSSVAALAEK